MASDIDEQLISQVVMNESGLDKALGSVISSVWAAGRKETFLQSLGRFVKNKEHEIEAISHHNHQHFVKSIDDLLIIRNTVVKLRDRGTILAEELSTAGHVLYDCRRQILDAQRMLLNLLKAELAVNDCLKGFNLAQRASLFFEDKNFADALRLVDELQSTQMRLIESYSFASRLKVWIPAQLERTRSYAIGHLRGWLTMVREQSENVGKLALRKSQDRLERWSRTPTGSALSDSGPVGAEEEYADALALIDNDQVRIDYTGLLEAMHLFELMGKRKEFLGLLGESRRQQLDIILQTHIHYGDPELRGLQTVFEQLAGFFILEYQLTQLPQDLYAMPWVESLWDQSLGRLATIAEEAAGASETSQSRLLKVKWAIVFLLNALRACPYPLGRLVEILTTLFYRFVEVLKTDCLGLLTEHISADPLAPLQISSANSLERFRATFSFLQDPRWDSATAFAFTDSVVEVYAAIQQFVNYFYVFLDGIPQASSEFDEIARKTVDSAILREANRLYLERAIEGNPGMAEFLGLHMNFKTLATLCEDIEGLLRSERSPMRTSVIRLEARRVFKASQQEVLARLETFLGQEITRLTAGALALERCPLGTPPTPSMYARDIVAYLMDTKNTLIGTVDPDSFCLLFRAACDTLSLALLNVLYDPTVTAMSVDYVRGVSLDLAFLEESIRSLFPEQESLFIPAFDELRESLALVLASSCHDYLDPSIKADVYGHLKSDKIVKLLAKITQPTAKKMSIEDLILLLGKQQL